MPSVTPGSGTGESDDADNQDSPLPRKKSQREPLQSVAANRMFLGDNMAQINEAANELANAAKALLDCTPGAANSNHPLPVTTTSPAVAPEQPPNPRPITVTCTENNGAPSQRHQKRTQKASNPALSRDVPEHLRLSDDTILTIGQTVHNGYERHRVAPYAFSRRGRIYKEYLHLLPRCTTEIISRLRQ